MQNQVRLKGGAFLVTAGMAVALLAVDIAPSSAGPFQWLTGRQQDNIQGRDGQQVSPNSGGSGSGGFRLFGGGSRSNPAAPPGASELNHDDPEALMITNPALGTPTLSSRNIAATKAAIENYRAIAARGGWPMVPGRVMRPGQRGQDIALLQQRLEASGDLVGMSVPGEYDGAVVGAVKRFQIRHGLPPTGVVDSKAMVAALNVPAGVRLSQLEINLKRLQKLAPSASGRYVLVNIPAAQVEAVEGGQVVLRNAAVVGKPERPTPELTSKIHEINFNPYWHVPQTIVQKDLVPKGREFARRGQDMLAAYHMQAFDQAGNPLHPQQIDWNGTEVYNYRFRQLPWEENSLGFVKINFPNKDAVYLHDTPLKSLFGQAVRFESSGCVRVHNVDRLVAWIMRSTPGWDLGRIQSMKRTREQLTVPIANRVPIYLSYISAWGTPDGQVHFRPDIYHHDGSATLATSAY
ncbi:MAG: L,D-transpeptidase family protein [Methyloceanibacter sp.]